MPSIIMQLGRQCMKRDIATRNYGLVKAQNWKGSKGHLLESLCSHSSPHCSLTGPVLLNCCHPGTGAFALEGRPIPSGTGIETSKASRIHRKHSLNRVHQHGWRQDSINIHTPLLYPATAYENVIRKVSHAQCIAQNYKTRINCIESCPGNRDRNTIKLY